MARFFFKKRHLPALVCGIFGNPWISVGNAFSRQTIDDDNIDRTIEVSKCTCSMSNPELKQLVGIQALQRLRRISLRSFCHMTS